MHESSKTGKENESTEDQGIHVDGFLLNFVYNSSFCVSKVGELNSDSQYCLQSS